MNLYVIKFYPNAASHTASYDYINAPSALAAENFYLHTNPRIEVVYVRPYGRYDPLFREVSNFYNDPDFFD
ncbi:hypothetical protein [Blackfly microvirus SF02]|uniref:Uncharacterized protein n=1 Tax=Blackfly microvirus SF02 TaxID=2576452 RepID=A0A4P8PK46_9VIRU|nr:hypothetical protein [Blackfly microvirus SF02]